ncbi:MAG TPA: CPBP family intramembrane glutamic endopeptidase, partial [Sphingomicrobium sp.]|nr:CPBP family intramembrane glutamic endopeptidase [Sphingomicrobium sp.]
TPPSPAPARDLVEVTVVYGLILAAVWTPQGRMNSALMLAAASSVVLVAFVGRWGWREMGFVQPLAGVRSMLLAGAVLCAAIAAIGAGVRAFGAGFPLPWARSWRYAIWALEQEFILQSIIFLRLESLVGGRRAVVAAAGLYALAHIPSPVLTILAFLGGLLFSDSFRRWRNLYPLGLIHAALGLTIAATLPDRWLHHMRVGIGYLTLH